MEYCNDIEELLDLLYKALMDNSFYNVTKVIYSLLDKYNLNDYVDDVDVFSISNKNAGSYNINRRTFNINTSYFLEELNKGILDRETFIFFYMQTILHELEHVLQEKMLKEDDTKIGNLFRVIRFLYINTDIYDRYYKYLSIERDANYNSNLLLILYSLKRELKGINLDARCCLKINNTSLYKKNNMEDILSKYAVYFNSDGLSDSDKIRYGFSIDNRKVIKELDHFNESIQFRNKTLRYLTGKKRV